MWALKKKFKKVYSFLIKHFLPFNIMLEDIESKSRTTLWRGGFISGRKCTCDTWWRECASQSLSKDISWTLIKYACIIFNCIVLKSIHLINILISYTQLWPSNNTFKHFFISTWNTLWNAWLLFVMHQNIYV